MRNRLLLSLGIGLLASTRLFAGFDLDLLETVRNQNDPAFSADAKAVANSINLSILQSQTRSKLPGRWRPYLDLGFHLVNIDDFKVRYFTGSLHAPNSFQAVVGRAGTGLPFGFAFQLAGSSIFSEHRFNGLSATLSHQVFDFSNIVYIDLVPAMTLSFTYSRTVTEPALQSYTVQPVFGLYHRQNLTELNYVFQWTYEDLTAIQPSYSTSLIRHGLVTVMPLIYGLNFKIEVYIPQPSGTALLNYQF